jgi:hypothetical protein
LNSSLIKFVTHQITNHQIIKSQIIKSSNQQITNQQITNHQITNHQIIKSQIIKSSNQQITNQQITNHQITNHQITNHQITNHQIGLMWHKDGYGGNDGDIGAPVYSLTLGNSCIFEYKPIGNNGLISVTLDSGDLIVFGGPQREMRHRVKSVIKGSFDKIKGFDSRINMTFRTCTGFSEKDEEYFQTDVYLKRLQDKWAKKETTTKKETI